MPQLKDSTSGAVEERNLAARLAEAENRLAVQRAALARCAAALAARDDPIVTLTTDGRITDWDAAAERLFGCPRGEVLGQPLAALVTLDPAARADARATALAGGRGVVEAAHVRPDGTPVRTTVTVSGVLDDGGRVTGLVAVIRDLSDVPASGTDVHRESKLESLGRLSAGLAHEINTPIQYVGDNARFLEEAYQELIRVVAVYRGLLDTSNPIGWTERQEQVRVAEASIDFDYLQTEIPSAVAQTLEGIERVARIVRAMKTFSHPGHQEQVHADLNEALEATVTVTRHQVSDVADLHLELGDLPPVLCNIADLNQVFLNLIVNAADAIEDTGRRGVIRIVTEATGNDVLVRISDTGAGIPDDVLPKIFDPFFTTKDVGRGSGQGLPLARGVVHQGHGGSLTLRSAPGEGTTFTVRLPIEGRALDTSAHHGA